MSVEAENIFRKSETLHAQPVAMGVARILRSRDAKEKLDACLKAAEIVTRYLAGLSLASYASREEEEDSGVLGLSEEISGNLAWGTFLQIVQRVYLREENHPAKGPLAPFRTKKEHKTSPEQHLIDLLDLRNTEGHSLNALSSAQAKTYIEGSNSILVKLAEVLRVMDRALSLPLFVVEETVYERKSFVTRLLWIMGQSPDPEPVELALDQGIDETGQPYVATKDGLLKLWPFFSWEMMEENLNRFALLQIDKIGENDVTMKPIESYEKRFEGRISPTKQLLDGKFSEIEPNPLSEGQSLLSIWLRERSRRQVALESSEASMPWEDFDEETLEWYAKLLERGSSKSPKAIISAILFDRRRDFDPEEIRQARLLFSAKERLPKVISRDLIDLRSIKEDSVRWDERINERINILAALRLAVDFVVRHTKLDTDTADELSETSGSSDYLAMRESIVNLFIHQDYTDESAAAQIELWPNKAMYSNQGYSMVSDARLADGGKSQSRNPLVARALRLIGFAELAGSGLRALSAAWRIAKRWPPRFESDRESNSFTLTLNWRSVDDYYDSYWKKRMGVKLTPKQAEILNLACDPEGITIQQAASSSGLRLEDVERCIAHLTTQGLVENNNGNVKLAKHLKNL